MVSKFKLDTAKNGETKETISRTFAIAKDYAGELSIEVLSLDNVELDPENNRELALTLNDAKHGIDPADPEYAKKKQDWKSLESLAKTIQEDQLINPIFVYRYGNKCRLIAGERRTLASAIAGKKEIIARIASQRPVGVKLRVLQWIENNERVDLSLAERIANLEAIVKEYCLENKEANNNERITAKTLSELTGMSSTQSRRYILILYAPLHIKKAISKGLLENIKLIELILSVENPVDQQLLFDAAIAGISFDDIVKMNKGIELGTKRKKGIVRHKQFHIDLGIVKPNIAKVILDALIRTLSYDDKVIDRLGVIHNSIEWGDVKSVEASFRKIISLIPQEA